ncbi:MAG: UPF0280 family protein [Desulfobacterales bacterium]|nr:UPF0280 family protein [Desulfobacterales bacterium]MDD4071173.1 UPF0280 family protein [Desulfobacterales bacterium]MDD4393361.1 UPF0280 family protein [Desulfobacterales bacterium]
MYQPRIYRNIIQSDSRVCFKVLVKETDLQVQAESHLEETAKKLVLKYRGHIEAYIRLHPGFATSLSPWVIQGPAPEIVRDMAEAGQNAGVGPMASVAGVISQYVGTELLAYSREVVVENGGDVFMKTRLPAVTGIYAGRSSFNLRLGIRVRSDLGPVSVCTSSGTVGHSLSLGNADAVCVVAGKCHFADAAATAIGNHVRSGQDIHHAIEFGKRLSHIQGIVIIKDDQIGMWGDIELVPTSGKNG